jgi:hypothetical protein
MPAYAGMTREDRRVQVYGGGMTYIEARELAPR